MDDESLFGGNRYYQSSSRVMGGKESPLGQ